MTEYQDLSRAHFEHTNLRGAMFTDVYLNDASLRDVDLSGAQIRMAVFNGTRMRGVELVDVAIYGELENVTVNGVDIAPLVEAELNRRMPERAKMRPDDADEFREAWSILEGLWKATVVHAKALPEDLGGLPFADTARSIELLATEVLPVVRQESALVVPTG